MIYKLLLSTLLIGSFISPIVAESIDLEDFDMTDLAITIPSSNIVAKSSLGDIKLLCDEQGFIIIKDDEWQRIPQYNIDDFLNELDLKTIAKYTLLGNKFKVIQFNNSEYAVKAQGGLRGGGVFGAQAGFHVGFFTVNFLAYGAIAIVSSFTGPAAPATFAALSLSLAPSIETAALTGGLAAGITGAVMTGPV